MLKDIKSTATTSAGYIYQNRQGIRVLCDWLDAPARYTRVKFECDNEIEAPKGLDDIVVERSDGLADLRQIKFTPDPDTYLLSWDWLLEKTGKTARSRSMLRKWFDAFKKLDPARIGELSLTTNRRPDAEIELCLDDDRIAFAKVPEPRRSQVMAELDGEANCTAFFDQLRIRHSDKGYVTLEHEIDARLQVHGTPEGIANLKYVALTQWATQNRLPPPDGWITLSEVHEILRATPPAPLPEDFMVPAGYEVPDATFHKEFAEDVAAAAGRAIVLTGPPGRGKSTYLSALCDTLADQDIPTVRHHYFLSTTERGRDRVHSHVVEYSIRAQVQRFHPDIATPVGGLRSLLEACASHYKALHKPFVLILDGLDHVWRINAQDTRPLDDLFSQIIPCPDNMVLLVGTQPVEDRQLPADLLVAAPKAGWRTLPAMSDNAILSYLHKAVREGRLTTGFEGRQAEESLQGAAAELRARTNGHPLHVIYATAELEHAGRRLSKWDVEQLKGDLDKDARFYYASLWERLSASLKDVLRLICAFPFFWPRTAFGEIAGAIGTVQPEIEKIEHLLHSSPAGLKVFHESLAVFVRATADYEEQVKALLPVVANWLDSAAPASLRVNWLWTVQAKLGDPTNLITGLTRDWVMLRLEEGYPESLFDTLLSDALVAALDKRAFAEAYRLAHLKSRMIGNSEFQMQDDDHARLTSFTLTLAADEGVVREAIASRHEADLLQVAALGLALHARGDQVLAETCGDEALRRFRGLSRFSSRYGSRADEDTFKFLADAFARLGMIGNTPESLAQLVDRNSPAVWLPRVRMLVGEGKLDDLMTVIGLLADDNDKRLLSDACVRAAAQAGVSIAERDDFGILLRTPFVASVEAAYTRVAKLLTIPIPVDWLNVDYYARKEDLATLAHHWFFSGVHLCLCMAAEGQTDFEHAPAPVYEGRENITEFLDVLSAVAAQVAHHWWRGEFVDFHELYELLKPVEPHQFRQSHDMSSAAADFRSALHRIACDIRLGSLLLDNTSGVALTTESMEAAAKCAWFDSASFRAQYAAGTLTRMTDEAAAVFVRSQRSVLDAEVWEETSVRLQTPLQLCAIAIAHHLLPDARKLCRQTWELATGYVHRKDATLNNTVDAIGDLVDAAPQDARRLLGRIAPQIHQVLQYTDGKGTRYVLEATDRLLAKLCPVALVAKYMEHTHAGDWSHAEDSLRAYVEQGVKEGWPLDALLRTGMHSEVLDALERLAEYGGTDAEERLRVFREHAGWDIGLLRREEHGNSDTGSKPYAGDVTTFAPEQLDDLLDSLSTSYGERAGHLRTWYQHWVVKGQGKRLLDALDGLLLTEEGRRKDVLVLSDLAFETRRKLSGKAAAWKYLVRAHILNGAWAGFMERDEKTRARLDLVVQHYPQRCDEFVATTTYGMFDDTATRRIAPSELMVYFYVRQGRVAEAVQFVETMVDCIVDDTRTLPLEQPRWAAELAAPTEEIA